jgi:hypothetical protein
VTAKERATVEVEKVTARWGDCMTPTELTAIEVWDESTLEPQRCNDALRLGEESAFRNVLFLGLRGTNQNTRESSNDKEDQVVSEPIMKTAMSFLTSRPGP